MDTGPFNVWKCAWQKIKKAIDQPLFNYQKKKTTKSVPKTTGASWDDPPKRGRPIGSTKQTRPVGLDFGVIFSHIDEETKNNIP
jgi:hypothetical protein